MYVRTTEQDGLTRENNCDLRRIYPWRDVVTPPWSSSLVAIRVGESSKRHQHPTDETFIFTSGVGEIQVVDETRTVGAGDVVYIPGGHDHTVTNTGTDQPLEFVSVFWPQPRDEQADA